MRRAEGGGKEEREDEWCMQEGREGPIGVEVVGGSQIHSFKGVELLDRNRRAHGEHVCHTGSFFLVIIPWLRQDI